MSEWGPLEGAAEREWDRMASLATAFRVPECLSTIWSSLWTLESGACDFPCVAGVGGPSGTRTEDTQSINNKEVMENVKNKTVQNPGHSSNFSSDLVQLISAWNNMSEAAKAEILKIAKARKKPR